MMTAVPGPEMDLKVTLNNSPFSGPGGMVP
jgi:hypothetical protein